MAAAQNWASSTAEECQIQMGVVDSCTRRTLPLFFSLVVVVVEAGESGGAVFLCMWEVQ